MLTGLLFAAALWPYIATTGTAGPGFALTSPHDLWAYLATDGVLVLLALGTSVALRAAEHDDDVSGARLSGW